MNHTSLRELIMRLTSSGQLELEHEITRIKRIDITCAFTVVLTI